MFEQTFSMRILEMINDKDSAEIWPATNRTEYSANFSAETWCRTEIQPISTNHQSIQHISAVWQYWQI